MATVKTPAITSAEATEAASSSSSADDGFHRVRRGEVAGDDDDSIEGYDGERMRARTSLTAEEEKKLIRRIDWHLMPLCSIIFMFKNLDSDNVSLESQVRPRKNESVLISISQVSNARIMNRGTSQNIMTQLGMTSDEYALITALYYVSFSMLHLRRQ